MMTKDQEREVLQKIKKLIDSTGSDSYIEAAFDGCIALAEENISNDFLTSFKERSEKAWADKLTAEAIQKDQAEVIKRLERNLDEIETMNRNQQQRIKDLESQLKEANQQIAESIKKDAAKFDEIQKLNNEMIALKAKLYDLMTA